MWWKGIPLKNVPTAVWVCITVSFVAVTGAFVALSISGADATEFRSFINTVLNFVAPVIASGAAIYAGAAAHNTEIIKQNQQQVKADLNSEGGDNGGPSV